MAATKQAEGLIEIKGVPAETVRVPIVGTSPLVVHRFSEKAKRQMLDNMQGRRSPKEAKDPEAEYRAAFYWMKDGETPGFPVIAFKAATIGAARFYSNLTMTLLKQCMFFAGEMGDDGRMLTPIYGEYEMRQDVVTVGRSGSDLRYRPQFKEWSTTLDITYVKSMLTQESLLSLLDAGGMGLGVGEWRPERNGDFGQFRVDTSKNIDIIPAIR